MKIKLKRSIIVCFIAFIISCANNEKAYDGFRRGMYEGADQVREMNSESPTTQQDKEPLTYDQYERERQEMISDHKRDQPKE